MAALASYREESDYFSLGVHKLVKTLLKGVKGFSPSCKTVIPQWDMELVLSNLCKSPFETIEDDT